MAKDSDGHGDGDGTTAQLSCRVLHARYRVTLLVRRTDGAT